MIFKKEKTSPVESIALEKKIQLLLEDLTSLEEYIRDVLTFSPVPIFFTSPLGIILEVNPAFEKIVGYAASEMVGQSIEVLFGKELSKKIIEEGLKAEFIKGLEANLLTKNKEKKIVLVFSKKRETEAEEIVGLFLSFLDITEQKKTEKELKDTQTALLNILEDVEEARKKIELERNKISAIINSLTDGLIVLDEDNKISFINQQLKDFFDFSSEEEIINKEIEELSKIYGFNQLLKILGQDIKLTFREEMVLKEDFILEVSTIPLVFEKRTIGKIIILHDVSREKIIEKLKTEFVSIAAHQLRTPLSAIKWTLKMFLDGDLGKITPEQKEYLEKTFISNERMISLVNSLLNVTRIEEGRFIYRQTKENLGTIVKQLLENYQDLFSQKNLTLETKISPETLPPVLVDVEKITLAIQNLVDNALKYTPSGGKVFISLEKENNNIKFTIKDTGLGIPKDQQERIFSRFFRGKNIVHIDTTGSGLGLFICKNIIEAHNGKIWFESEEGKGTTFYFVLPAASE